MWVSSGFGFVGCLDLLVFLVGVWVWIVFVMFAMVFVFVLFVLWLCCVCLCLSLDFGLFGGFDTYFCVVFCWYFVLMFNA